MYLYWFLLGFCCCCFAPKWEFIHALRLFFLHCLFPFLSWGDEVLVYLHAQCTPGSCRTKLIIRLMQVTFLPSPGLESQSSCMKHGEAWLPQNIQTLEVNFYHPLFPCSFKPLKELKAILKLEGFLCYCHFYFVCLSVCLIDWLNTGFFIQNGRNIFSVSTELKVLELGAGWVVLELGDQAHKILPAPPLQRSARNLDKAEKQISDTWVGVPFSSFLLCLSLQQGCSVNVVCHSSHWS